MLLPWLPHAGRRRGAIRVPAAQPPAEHGLAGPRTQHQLRQQPEPCRWVQRAGCSFRCRRRTASPAAAPLPPPPRLLQVRFGLASSYCTIDAFVTQRKGSFATFCSNRAFCVASPAARSLVDPQNSHSFTRWSSSARLSPRLPPPPARCRTTPAMAQGGFDLAQFLAAVAIPADQEEVLNSSQGRPLACCLHGGPLLPPLPAKTRHLRCVSVHLLRSHPSSCPCTALIAPNLGLVQPGGHLMLETSCSRWHGRPTRRRRLPHRRCRCGRLRWRQAPSCSRVSEV